MAGFIEIPAGPFTMGSERLRDKWMEDGDLVDTVELPTYYIARFETTWAQYRLFLKSENRSGEKTTPTFGSPDEPALRVSWTDATAYARWLGPHLSGAAGLTTLLDRGWTVRLPSEAEWEKAARGSHALRGSAAWIYPWGDEIDETRANYSRDGSWRGPMPVGSFPAGRSPYGVHDMAGNAWEWTRSRYRDVRAPRAPIRQTDTPLADAWTIRGGGFGEWARMVRIATRHGYVPSMNPPKFGFRVALVRPGTEFD